MQVMKREGVLDGRSSNGVVVPLVKRVGVFAEERDERMPERMAMPNVPNSCYQYSCSCSLVLC